MTQVLGQSVGTPATQEPVAETQAQNPEPAIDEAKESREPEAFPDADAEADKTAQSGAAIVKKLRTIKSPVEHVDPTLYLKTWTGDYR